LRVYILTLRENNESSKLIQNLGVFSRRALGLEYILELGKKDTKFRIGRYCSSVDELVNLENELNFDPKLLIIFSNDFYKVVAETSILK